VTWGGFISGDNASNALSSASFTYGGATPGFVNNGGSYTLGISGITASNYQLGSVTDGTLVITGAQSTPISLPSSVVFEINNFPVLANNLGNAQYIPYYSEPASGSSGQQGTQNGNVGNVLPPLPQLPTDKPLQILVDPMLQESLGLPAQL